MWVFRAGALTIVRDDQTHDAKIWTDPSVSPKQLDSDMLFQPTGIYEIDGDTLRISQAVRTMPRPTEFKTTWGDLRTVSVLRRVEGDPWMSLDALRGLLRSEFGPAPEYPERIEFDEEAADFVSDLLDDISLKSGEKSAREAAVFHISWLIIEVNNGGFHQYFFNSTGEHAVETAAMLRKIGAQQTAALIESGCQLFPNGAPPKDLEERRAQLDQFSLKQLEKLRDLEERFYSRREDLKLLLKQYWQSQP